MRRHGPIGEARSRRILALLVLAGALAGGGPAGVRGATDREEPGAADPAIETGKALYVDHCSKCHGEDANGKGQLAVWLDTPPPDLTVLSRGNGGTFPFDEVLKTIDGTVESEGHAPSDMPVWGEVFKLTDHEASAEEIAEKLRSLTVYVRSLQQGEPDSPPDG